MKILKRLFLGFVIFAAIWVTLVFLTQDGISTSIQLPEAVVKQDLQLEGLTCEQRRIPVALTKDKPKNYNIVGELCWLGELKGQTVQVLISGAGYGPIYWDFPYLPETYSYKWAALKQGFATFNYYRLGIGESDHPFGVSVNVDGHAHSLNDIIENLRAEGIAKVITVGHSLGSVTAIGNAVHYPGAADGVILTGFFHNTNPGFVEAMQRGVNFAPFSSDFAGDIFDVTYFISKKDTRGGDFYTSINTDPMVPVIDELNRQPLTVGEVISMRKYFGPASKAIKVPVKIVTGEYDFVSCGGALDCTDHQATIDHEKQFFSEEACVQTHVFDDINHNITLHKQAPEVMKVMLDWALRVEQGIACDPS